VPTKYKTNRILLSSWTRSHEKIAIPNQAPISQIFLASNFKKIFSSPQCAHVTFFVNRDQLELAVWLLRSKHAEIQVPRDGVMISRNCRCQSFAACTVDVTVCFNRQTVSALTLGFSRYYAQPTLCWLNLAYFG